GDPLYSYTPRFEDDVKFSGRVLAAFDAEYGDARTCGNTLVQLLVNNASTLPKTDGTLAGPTSEAWFKPWRRYLESIGVQFHPGRLHRFEHADWNNDGVLDGVVPWVSAWDH